jgi:hypothetical protein
MPLRPRYYANELPPPTFIHFILVSLLSIAGNLKGSASLDQNLDAAKRQFPARGRTIDELALRDEDFRSLCVDLGDAEAAAVKWEHSASPTRDERGAEYLALVADLAKEIEAALDKAAIIPLESRRPKAP